MYGTVIASAIAMFRNIFSRRLTEKATQITVKSKGMFSSGMEGSGEDMCSHARAAAQKRRAQAQADVPPS